MIAFTKTIGYPAFSRRLARPRPGAKNLTNWVLNKIGKQKKHGN